MISRTHDESLIRAMLTSVDGFGHVRNFYNKNIIYLYDDGCLFCCAPCMNFISCHVAITPEKRGAIAVRAGRDAIQWLSDNTSQRIFVRTRKGLKNARMYNNMIGLKMTSQNDKFCFYGVG